jgi:multiple sugar transport system permease protein
MRYDLPRGGKRSSLWGDLFRGVVAQVNLRNLVLGIALSFFAFFTLFPVGWMVLTSFRNDQAIDSHPFDIALQDLSLDQYVKLLSDPYFPFPKWVLNSLFVSVVSSVVAIFVGGIAAYSLGRLKFRGGTVIGLSIFSTYLLPPVLLFIPLRVLAARLGLPSNSLWTLTLTYLSFLVPFIAWTLSSYFRGLPIELLEAARIDGASRLRAMLAIDMPLVLPGVISVFFFAFTLSWGEYMYALTFMSQKLAYTVPLGMVNEAQVGDLYYWGKLMAGAVLGSVPVVIVYSFLMDYYLAGMTAGAVKG